MFELLAPRRRSARAALLVAVFFAMLVLVLVTPSSALAGYRTSPGARGLVVRIDTGHPGVVVPSDFMGLSLETPALETPALDSSALEAQASPLAHLLGDLGPGVLRVSGASADHTQWLSTPEAIAPWAAATETPADLQDVAALMRATGWRLVLGLDLGHLNPVSLVDEARAATSILGPSLAGLEIGNEPDLYAGPVAVPFRSVLGGKALRPRAWGLSTYQAEITAVRASLATAGVSAPVYGPDTATRGWLGGYAAQQGAGLAALTTHLYPLDRCRRGRVVFPAPSIASLLSRRVARNEALDVAGFVHVAASHGLPLRIDETSSVACGGQPGTSDTFAAGLWAVDFSLLAASEGVSGLNFHGALGSCQRGGTILSPWYSPLCTLPDGQMHARPEYYGLLMLRSLEGCAFLPTAYRTTRDVSVYALRAADGSLRVVLDDMQTRPSTRSTPAAQRPGPVSVTLRVGGGYQHAGVVRLSAPSLVAKTGVTLGGVSLSADGSIPPAMPEPVSGSSGSFVLELRPGSAALVTLAA